MKLRIEKETNWNGKEYYWLYVDDSLPELCENEADAIGKFNKAKDFFIKNKEFSTRKTIISYE